MAEFWANRSGAGVYTDGQGELMESKTQVPDGWEVVRLGDIAQVRSGVGFPLERQGRRNGVYPFIKVSDMNLVGNETYIRNANNYIDQQDTRELGATVFPPGTVVFPKVGAAIATNKKRALTVPTIIDNNMMGVTAEGCDPRFLHNWFTLTDLSHFANVSAVPSITGSRVQRLLVTLPPLNEQRAIAAVLDSIDDAIKRTDAVIAATERLRDTLLHELLTRGVRGWHSEWKQVLGIGTLPACWEVVRLGEIATLQRGMDLPSDKRLPGDVPVYGANGIHGVHNSSPIDGPGVITGRSGSMGLVHYTESSYWPLNTTLYVKDFHGNNERFVYYFLSGMGLERFAASTGVPSLNRNFVHPIRVSIPPLAEQLTIVAVLDSVKEAAERGREESDVLQSLKAAASDALLTGHVRVSV